MVHWRRAPGGALDSLVASMVVVPDQKGGIWQYVRTEQIIGPMTDLPYSTGVIRAGRKVDERVILPFHNEEQQCAVSRHGVREGSNISPNQSGALTSSSSVDFRLSHIRVEKREVYR
jgi:hypothetical protein